MNLTQSLRVGIIAGLIMIAFCISCSGIEPEDAGHLQVEFSLNYSLDANMGELYSSEIPLTNLSLQLESLETDIFNDPRSTSDWVRCLADYESRLRERAVRLAHIEAQFREEWPELNDDERIEKTRILEDLLRRQAVHLYDFQYHLKKRYCHLTFSDQMEFLHSFEDLLDRESLLLEGFEGFLHQMQNVQDQYQMEFLASFEDLIRRQAILLDIYEDLLKTRCNELRLYKYVVRCGEFRCGQNITYNYVLSNTCNCTFEGVKIIDDRLGVVVDGVSLRPHEKKVFAKSTILNYTSGTTVCNTASAIGVDSDGFTIFSPSNEVCITIAEPLQNHNLDLINLGSQKTIAFASDSAVAENSILIKKNQDGRSSSNNDKVNRDAIRVGDQLANAHQNSKASNSIKIVSNQGSSMHLHFPLLQITTKYLK